MKRSRRKTQQEAVYVDLVEGVLYDGDFIRLELVRDSVGNPPHVVTARVTPFLSRRSPEASANQINYFNLRVERLPNLLRDMVAAFTEKAPGDTIGLHRLVCAVAGKFIPDGFEVHHVNHNHLDNRADNLHPVNAGAHREYHAKNPRWQQLKMFNERTDVLYLRTTFHPGATEYIDRQRQRTIDPAAITPILTPRGSVPLSFSIEGVNADQTTPEGELMFDSAVQNDVVVTSDAKVWQSRQLERLGFPRKAAKRASEVLRLLARHQGFTQYRDIQAHFDEKMCQSRTLQNTLRVMISRGLIVRQGRRYGITHRAVRSG